MDQISRQLSVSQISGSLYRSTGCKNLGIEFQDLGHRYVIFHRWKKKCACIIWLILLIYRHLVKCKLEQFLITFKVFYRFLKNEYHHLVFKKKNAQWVRVILRIFFLNIETRAFYMHITKTYRSMKIYEYVRYLSKKYLDYINL